MAKPERKPSPPDGVVVIAGYLLGSGRVFSGFLPRRTTDISWHMGPGLCFLKCDTDKLDVPNYIPPVLPTIYSPAVPDYYIPAVPDYIPAFPNYIPPVPDYIPPVPDYIPAVPDYIPAVPD